MILQSLATAKPLFADRTPYVGVATTLADLASPINWPQGHFVLLLAADTTAWETGEAVAWATRAIQAGGIYVCCWGPGCEDMHATFDHAGFLAEQDAGRELPVIMTTDHHSEPLIEALWFAASATWPAEEYSVDCKSLVVLVVGDLTWGTEARTFLEAGAPLPNEA